MSNNSFNKKKRLKLIIKVSPKKRDEVILTASALRKVKMDNWHLPYETKANVLELEYDFISWPIRTIRLYFMLHRNIRCTFEFN